MPHVVSSHAVHQEDKNHILLVHFIVFVCQSLTQALPNIDCVYKDKSAYIHPSDTY